MSPRVVIDSSVLVVGLMSNTGASFRLLSLVGRGRFQFCLSVPLLVAYEAATKRHSRALGLTHADIDAFLDYLCAVGERRQVYYLWRPVLKDPADDSLLELAVEAGCDSIVTQNVRGFGNINQDETTASRARQDTPAMLEDRMGRVLSTLTRREEKVLRLRLGLGDDSPHSLEEVGSIFKVTRERVRQIEAKALHKLRRPYRGRKLKCDGEIIAATLFGVRVSTPTQFLRQIGEIP